MAHFKMKYFGSGDGKSGKGYHFDKGQIIEAGAGEFSAEMAEDVTKDFVVASKEVEKPKKEAYRVK
jgi:hypothetical protein